ncbi:MAG: DUF3311 domain-containing protein [bacterium]|nr:DUF3311 domain-containing protein [bacterium]
MLARMRYALAAVPMAALSIAVPFANRVEPRILGLPFILAWIAIWVLVTPLCIWALGRIEHRW